MTEAEAKRILAEYGAPANIAPQHMERAKQPEKEVNEC